MAEIVYDYPDELFCSNCNKITNQKILDYEKCTRITNR